MHLRLGAVVLGGRSSSATTGAIQGERLEDVLYPANSKSRIKTRNSAAAISMICRSHRGRTLPGVAVCSAAAVVPVQPRAKYVPRRAKTPPTKTSSTLVGHKKPRRRRRGFLWVMRLNLIERAIPRSLWVPSSRPWSNSSTTPDTLVFRLFAGGEVAERKRCHQRAFASPFIFIRRGGILIPDSAEFELDFINLSIL